MEMTSRQSEAFYRAAALCSRAEKCSADVLTKLSQWGVDEMDAGVVLKQLIEEKYVDDERFARSFAKDKFRFNKWGKIKIAYQLHAKRMNSNTVDLAMNGIDDEAYWEMLIEIITEKNKSVKVPNPYDRKAKLIRFAQARGFEMDLIYRAVEEVLT
nr:RecX family transcriptional regulator [Sunxiuqinia sp.]